MKKFLIFALVMAVIGNEVCDYGVTTIAKANTTKAAALANI